MKTLIQRLAIGIGAILAIIVGHFAYADTQTVSPNQLLTTNVYPEAYGAVGNGVTNYTGALTINPPSASLGSTSTASISSPAITTIANNDVVLNTFQTGATYTSNPSPGTNVINIPILTGKFAEYANIQNAVSPGIVATSTGSLNSTTSTWMTATIAIQPISGQTITIDGSSTSQVAGPTSTIVTVPAGTVNGDLMVECTDWYSGSGNTTVIPTAFNMSLSSTTENTTFHHTCAARIANNEPGSYTWNQNGTSGMTVFILSLHNALGLDNLSSLNDASATFTSATVGNLICISGVRSGGGQGCGTVSQYVSPTNIDLTIASATVNTTSSIYTYGTNDSTAFSTMIGTAPCSTVGCHIQIGAKQYILATPIVLPTNTAISISGVAAGVSNTENAYVGANVVVNNNTGSRLVWDVQNMTSSAISLLGVSGASSFTVGDTLSNFSILGGVGRLMDGGGADGLDIFNWQDATINDLYVGNFVGNGVYVDSTGTSQSGVNYTEELNFNHLESYWNGGKGFQEGSAGSQEWLESTKIENSIIENNGSNGLYLDSNAVNDILGFSMTNTVLQWDNRNVSSSEMFVTGPVSGCDIRGNYFEYDNIGGSQSNNWNNFSATDICDYGQNVLNGGTATIVPNDSVNYTSAAAISTKKGYITTTVTSTAATPAINVQSGNFSITLSTNTTPTVTGITKGINFNIQVCQPASGGPYAFTWPAAFIGHEYTPQTASTCMNQTFQSFDGSTLVSSPFYFVVTPSIGGAIVGVGCDLATTTVDTSISSSTTVFPTSPIGDPGNVPSPYTFLLSAGLIETKVCSGATVTPNSVPYIVKIL